MRAGVEGQGPPREPAVPSRDLAKGFDALNTPGKSSPAVLNAELPSILVLFFRNSHC